MDANLTVTAADKKILGSNGGYHGRDPLVDLLVPADGDYLVKVHDLSYRGGFPYRLVVSDRPQVEAAFPRAVRAGKPTTLTFLGRNLGAGSKPSAFRELDLPLDEAPFEVTPPADCSTGGLPLRRTPDRLRRPADRGDLYAPRLPGRPEVRRRRRQRAVALPRRQPGHGGGRAERHRGDGPADRAAGRRVAAASTGRATPTGSSSRRPTPALMRSRCTASGSACGPTRTSW